MPESGDYSPAPWASHDTFASARSAYDVHVGRSYDDAKKKGIIAKDLVPASVESDSENPIVILCDVTGSMGSWPATIFSKLPYLDHEAKFYFDDKYEICFGAIGDAFSDSYPLQVQPFGSGKDMEATLKKLVIERGGGGGNHESYDLGALYFAKNAETPKAIRPLLIFIGDENVYDTTFKDKASECCKVNLKENMSVEEVFEELKKKFDVYIIRKNYDEGGGNTRSASEESNQKRWSKLLGEDHVAMLPEAERVVDVIFGIFARVTGKIKEFRKELEDRQGKDKDGTHKIDVTMKALFTIHRDAAAKYPHKSLKKLPGPKGASVTRRTSGSKSIKTSKSLLDE